MAFSHGEYLDTDRQLVPAVDFGREANPIGALNARFQQGFYVPSGKSRHTSLPL